MRDINDKPLDQYGYATDPVLQKALHARDKVTLGTMESCNRSVSNFGRQMIAHQSGRRLTDVRTL